MGVRLWVSKKFKKRSVEIWGDKNKKKYDNYYSISDLKEKPKINEAPSSLTIVGRYLLNSRIFSFLSRQKKGMEMKSN